MKLEHEAPLPANGHRYAVPPRPAAAGRSSLATLSSNGVDIPFGAHLFSPLRDSTGWCHHPQVLRQHYEEQGYLLLRGVLERRRVLELRADYFARFGSSILAAHGTAGHPAYDFVRSEDFDEFSRNPRLLELAELLLDGPAEMLPRRIVRHFNPASGRASRAHVDYDYLDQGSDALVTAWIPLGDCSVACGGLVYLEGSHRLHREALEALRPFTDRPADRRPLSNDLGRTASTLGGRWLWSDYRAGDVVLHSPHIVHASLDNVSDVMRLSTDVRFRRRDAAADERWNGDWSADDGY